MDRYTGHKVIGGFLVGALLSGMVLNAVFMRWPPEAQYLFGDTGVVASLAAVIGVAGAIAAGIGVYLSDKRSAENLRLTQVTEISTRFQRGAELLKDPRSAVAGMALLSQVAQDDARRFQMPILRTLADYAGRDAEVREPFVALNRRPFGSYEGSWPIAEGTAVAAITAAGRIFGTAQEKFDDTKELLDGRLALDRSYLSGFTIQDSILRDMELRNTVVNGTFFEKVDLRNTELLGWVGPDGVSFVDCDLTGFHLILRDAANRPVPPRMIVVKDCAGTDDARINSLPWKMYLALPDSSPQFAKGPAVT